MSNATVHGSHKYPAVVVPKAGSSRDRNEDRFAVSGYLGSMFFVLSIVGFVVRRPFDWEMRQTGEFIA
jgi:hypothetical protein